MCGIVGYVGEKQALEVVVGGLRRMEYSGYESAGVAVVCDDELYTRKKAGKLANLETLLGDDPLPASTIGIGHTRWATHGGPTDANAHPHERGRPGRRHPQRIIENFAELREELTAAGAPVERDRHRGRGPPARRCCPSRRGPHRGDAPRGSRLEARSRWWPHAEVPDVVVGARRNSPLVVGVGEGEAFLASDVAAFIEFTRDAIELGQDQVVEVTRDGVTVTDFDGNPAEVTPFTVDWDAAAAEKGGYDLFMLKEIAEQPKAVADTLRGRIDRDGTLRLDDMKITPSELREISKIVVVACGTAYHAGMVAKYAIEHWTRIPVEVELSSEFR
jgi:glucosamine--fructose-6-phosphate aminotransferase (isomerizing)